LLIDAVVSLSGEQADTTAAKVTRAAKHLMRSSGRLKPRFMLHQFSDFRQ
jgi:hypothetical protein